MLFSPRRRRSVARGRQSTPQVVPSLKKVLVARQESRRNKVWKQRLPILNQPSVMCVTNQPHQIVSEHRRCVLLVVFTNKVLIV